MPAGKDLTGMRFGRLFVKGKTTWSKGKGIRSRKQWECICDCGTIKFLVSENLLGGHTNSCGCLRKETSTQQLLTNPKMIQTRINNTLPSGDSSCNSVYNRYVQGAKKNVKKVWGLSRSDFKILTSSNCFYCGTPPIETHQGPRSNGAYTYNGIDRVNSDLGYTLDNCVPCCKYCNYAKNSFDQYDFLEWTKRLANYKFTNQISNDKICIICGCIYSKVLLSIHVCQKCGSDTFIAA
jgi:5-methylcytosine-specific restriction endonuclease McrA